MASVCAPCLPCSGSHSATASMLGAPPHPCPALQGAVPARGEHVPGAGVLPQVGGVLPKLPEQPPCLCCCPATPMQAPAACARVLPNAGVFLPPCCPPCPPAMPAAGARWAPCCLIGAQPLRPFGVCLPTFSSTCRRGTLDAMLHHSAKRPWDPQKLLPLVRRCAPLPTCACLPACLPVCLPAALSPLTAAPPPTCVCLPPLPLGGATRR